MTELKPCPFCGCEVKIVIGIFGVCGAPDYFMIEHPENDCMMDGFTSFCSVDKDELVEAWNTRREE